MPTHLPACTPKRFDTDAPSPFPAEAASRQRTFPFAYRGGSAPRRLHADAPSHLHAEAASRRRIFRFNTEAVYAFSGITSKRRGRGGKESPLLEPA